MPAHSATPRPACTRPLPPRRRPTPARARSRLDQERNMVQCSDLKTMNRAIAVALCASLAFSGCAPVTRKQHAQSQVPAAATDNTTALISAYVQKLPLGTRVRVERTEGGAIRGTLMNATADTLVVQRNTRIPEPPMDIAIAHVTRVTVEDGHGGGWGK